MEEKKESLSNVGKYFEQQPQQQEINDMLIKLTVQQNQSLINCIASMMLTPMSSTRISQVTQKLSKIQSEVISVVEHRVRLEHCLQVENLKDGHFETVCQLYDMIKERDRQIDWLGKMNAELDSRYLMKVAELEDLRVNYVSLKSQLDTIRIQANGGLAGRQRDQQEEMKQLEREIISLKQTFRNFFTRSASHNDQDQHQPLDNHELFPILEFAQPQNDRHLNRQTNLSEKLRQEISLLRSSLALRLQMIQDSGEASDKYQSTQQQLIDRLMDELMRQKQATINGLRIEAEALKGRRKRDLVEDSQETNQTYEKSSSDLNCILEMELVSMKQKLEQYEQNNQNLVDSERIISELTQSIKQKDNKLGELYEKISHLQDKLQQAKVTHEQTVKQIQLLSTSQIQEAELKHIQQKQSLNRQLQKLNKQLELMKKASEHLKNEQVNKAQQIQNEQLSKAQQQINRLLEASQSLSNEKILIKTLNKKLSKETADANDDKKQAYEQRDQALEQRDQALEQRDQALEQRDQLICENLELSTQNDSLLAEKTQLLKFHGLLQAQIETLKAENAQMRLQMDKLDDERKSIKQLLQNRANDLSNGLSNKQAELNQIKLQLSIKNEAVNQLQNQLIGSQKLATEKQTELREYLSQLFQASLKLKDFQTKQITTQKMLENANNCVNELKVKLENDLLSQQQLYQTKICLLDSTIQSFSQTANSLQLQKQGLLSTNNNLNSTVSNFQLQLKKLDLALQQKDQQISLLNNLFVEQRPRNRPSWKQQPIAETQLGQNKRQQNGEKSEEKNEPTLSQRQAALSLSESKLNQLILLIKASQQQLQHKQTELLQQEQSMRKMLAQKQSSINYKQALFCLELTKLQRQQQSIAQREFSIAQREEKLKQNQQNYELNFNQTREMFVQEAELLETRENQLSRSQIQLEEIKQSLEQRILQITQKEHQIQISHEQMHLKQSQIDEAFQQIHRQRQTLKQLRQSIDESRQQPLSPPPSPFQHPIDSPNSPSPLIRFQALHQITSTVSESYKGRLQVYPVRQSFSLPQQEIQKVPGLKHVDEVCKSIADNWMKTQQEKWNLIHFQLNSLAQLVFNTQM